MTIDGGGGIPTRVGRADWGDNQFRGFKVLGELAGRDGFWSVVSLAVGNRRLEADEAAVLDDICTCSISADPRIWPLKVARLISSYGASLPALCSSLVFFEEALVGPAAAGAAAQFLVDLHRELGSQVDDAGALESTLVERMNRGQRFPGFGVPFRDVDERAVALTVCVERRGHHTRPHWRLMSSASEIVARHKRVRANIGCAMAAVCLDMGFNPRQVTHLATVALSVNVLANAAEGSEEPAAILRRLPSESIAYVGPAARKSPRALGQP